MRAPCAHTQRGAHREKSARFARLKTPIVKCDRACADGCTDMQHTAPNSTPETHAGTHANAHIGTHTNSGTDLVTATTGAHLADTRIHPGADADAFAVSAADLIELIRSGHGADLNELVQRTLGTRRAA